MVIKFVKRYSQECHSRCFELGIAPELLAFQPLPGGWHVVIMEFLQSYETLFVLHRDRKVTDKMIGAVEKAVGKLHEEDFVHGDLRLPNIMVGPEDSVKFVDFDWSGRLGEALYPPLMNPVIVWHPGAKLGEEIVPEHDMYLLRSELSRTD